MIWSDSCVIKFPNQQHSVSTEFMINVMQATLEILTHERDVLQSSLHQHGGAVAALQAETAQVMAGANAQVQVLSLRDRYCLVFIYSTKTLTVAPCHGSIKRF